jgi:pyridoxine kinase
MMGRHPGWGSPGGGAVETHTLKAMWDAIRKQDIKFDGVLSGYMGKPSQVDLCRDIITDVKRKNTKAHILVDPVMGDHGKLYISPDIAEGIKTKLIPLADTVTPNLCELSFLTQTEDATLMEQLKAAKRMAPQVLITSVENASDIGAVLINSKEASQVSHKRYDSVPHGGGDCLAATFLAHQLAGASGKKAMERSVASIFSIMSAANALDAGELPLIREQDALVNAKPLRSRALEL